MKPGKGILLLAVEMEGLGLAPSVAASLLLRKIAVDLDRHDSTADRAYAQVGRGSQALGRWLYIVGGNSELTQKAEAALDAMFKATDSAPERDVPEEPSAGDLKGWPHGKVVIFDKEGRPMMSISPHAVKLIDGFTGKPIPTGEEDARF